MHASRYITGIFGKDNLQYQHLDLQQFWANMVSANVFLVLLRKTDFYHLTISNIFDEFYPKLLWRTPLTTNKHLETY